MRLRRSSRGRSSTLQSTYGPAERASVPLSRSGNAVYVRAALAEGVREAGTEHCPEER